MSDASSAAKAKGVRFGPKPIEKPQEYESLDQAWKAGLISSRDAAKRVGVSHTIFLRWSKG